MSEAIKNNNNEEVAAQIHRHIVGNYVEEFEKIVLKLQNYVIIE
jgi:hypothetical protein